ncbi:NPC intracellular sterol transporter 1-related protein 1 [Diutina catenulata]
MRLRTVGTWLSAAAIASAQCAMYDDCGKKSVFGASLPCVAPVDPVAPSPEVADLAKRICGDDFDTTALCCSESQLKAMEKSLKRVDAIVGSCPACHHNFYRFICEFTCGPHQAEFVEVTKSQSAIDTGREIVTEITQYVDPKYAAAFYDSCKEVKFSATNGRAMDLIGGGAQNYSQFLEFLGDEKPMLGGSPFQINFAYEGKKHFVPRGKAGDMKGCSDEDYRCACPDCPSSCPELPAVRVRDRCTVGGLHCFSFAIAITWACLFAILLGYHLYMRRRLDDFDDVDDDIEVVLESEPNYFKRASEASIKSIEQMFYAVGKICARNPGRIITANVVVCLVLASGLFWIKLEQDPIKLWVSSREPELHHKQYFEQQFGEWFRVEQVIVSSNDGKPVLDWDTVKWWFDEEEKLNDMGLESVCFKPLGGTCAVESFTQWFGGDRNQVSRDSWKQQMQHCAQSPVDCLPSFQQPLGANLLFDNDDPTKAHAFTVTVLVNSNSSDTDYTSQVEKFEKRVQHWMAKLKHPRVNVAYSTERSLEEELNQSSNTDARIVVVSYLAMFVYVAVALGGTIPTKAHHLVGSRITFALTGILAVVLSVLASAGFFSYLGVRSTLIIAEVIPFLVLAVGVDNLFLLVDELNAVNAIFPHDRVARRIGEMLRRVGPSCMASALIQFSMFVLATVVDMPAVRNFAIYSAGAIFINFYLQMTGLVSMLALDQKRLEDNRMDIFWWKKAPARPADTHTDHGHHDPHDHTACEDDEPRFDLHRWVKKVYAPWILDASVKPKIVASFAVLLGISLALLPSIPLGLDQRIAIPSDSYLVDYFDAVYQHFNAGPPVFFVVRGLNVTSREAQKQVCGKFSGCDEFSIANVLEQEHQRPEVSTIIDPATSWLDDFLLWLDPNIDCCRVKKREPEEFCGPHAPSRQCQACYANKPYDTFMNGFPEGSQFMHYFSEWIESPSDPCPLGGKAPYSTSVSWNATDIVASYWRTSHAPLRSQADFIEAYRQARRIVNDIKHYQDLDVFAFSPFYIYFVQYSTIVKLTFTLLAGACAVIWLLSVVLLGSLASGSVMVVVVAAILVNIGGAMAVFGVSLNAVSLVNLIICAGLAVEFCIHLTRAYTMSVVYDADEASLYSDLVANGLVDDPATGVNQLKAFQALSTVGASVLGGITTTKIIGIGVLAFTKSKIFDVYYFRMWAALIVFASIHALALLPILLSYFGDSSKPVYTITI